MIPGVKIFWSFTFCCKVLQKVTLDAKESPIRACTILPTLGRRVNAGVAGEYGTNMHLHTTREEKPFHSNHPVRGSHMVRLEADAVRSMQNLSFTHTTRMHYYLD